MNTDNPMSQRRSIRDVRKDSGHTPPSSMTPQEKPEPLSRFPERRYHSKSRTTLAIWAIGIFVATFLFFLISTFFSKAQVSVTPRTEQVSLQGSLSALLDSEETDLNIAYITTNDEVSQSVTATGEEFVEEKATGLITVYNDYDTESQILIATTRFRTPEGLVYRITEGITVPGQTVVDGKSVPGSVEVRVFADETGEDYNIGPARFDVPGFEGTPQFDGFYAVSESSMEGGFSGVRKSASEADREEALVGLETTLREALLKKALSESPEGFVTLPQTAEVTVSELPDENDGENVRVRLGGEIRVAIVSGEELAQVIAEKEVTGYSGEPLHITNLGSLNILLKDSEEEEDTMQLTIADLINLEWDFNSEELASDLAGKSSKDAGAVLGQHPGVAKIDINLSPAWKRSLPSDPTDIEIVKAQNNE